MRPPINPIPYGIFELPITLPSCLAIARLNIPIPMSAADFDYMLASIKLLREAVIDPPGAKVLPDEEGGK